jgi:type I restriction enzyme R subunit
MNEAETRAELIDPALKAAGWGVVEGSRIRREKLCEITPGRIEGKGKRGKPLIADYILEYRNTKLAVIEAKAVTMSITEGVGQAKLYAGKLGVRFTYATNGKGIYGIDMHTGAEGDVEAYPSPDELWNRTFPKEDTWRDRFAAVSYEDKGGSHPARYYQDTAIERVLEAIGTGDDRILLTLATGTGKTFIAFQLAWKLFHSRWNRSGEPTRRPHPLPGRPKHSGKPSLQCFLGVRGLKSRRARAHQAGGHPQKGQGAEEWQCLLYHLPDLPFGSTGDRLLRGVSAGLLRLHHHRRVSSRGCQ